MGNAAFSRTKDISFENANFLHIRYNYKLSKYLRWEAFTQIQSNLPIGVRYRYLAGTGPRLKLISAEHFNLYLGILYMYEFEKTSDSIHNKQHFNRSSNYCSFTIAFPKIKGEVISTTYYQPDLRNFSDYRLFTENRLEFSITKKLKALTNFNYFFDSRPPNGINDYTTAFSQGLGIRF